jgi:hypothetical protein
MQQTGFENYIARPLDHVLFVITALACSSYNAVTSVIIAKRGQRKNISMIYSEVRWTFLYVCFEAPMLQCTVSGF